MNAKYSVEKGIVHSMKIIIVGWKDVEWDVKRLFRTTPLQCCFKGGRITVFCALDIQSFVRRTGESKRNETKLPFDVACKLSAGVPCED
jgi:hypothetical protein